MNSLLNIFYCNNQLEKKRFELASYYQSSRTTDLFLAILYYLEKFPYSTYQEQKSLYQEMTSEENINRFLPDNQQIKANLLNLHSNEPAIEFIAVCKQCLQLFRKVIQGNKNSEEMVHELFYDTFIKIEEIHQFEINHSNWNRFIDFSPKPALSIEEENNYECLVESAFEDFSQRIDALLERLESEPLEYYPLPEQENLWNPETTTIKKGFSIRPNKGYTFYLSTLTDQGENHAILKINKREEKLVVNTFQVSPFNHSDTIENLALHLIINLLKEDPDCEEALLKGEFGQIQVQDRLAYEQGFTPCHPLMLEKLGTMYADNWILSKDSL